MGCLLLLVLALSAPAAEMPEWFWVFSEPTTASRLLGREVRDRSGARVGEITDLIVDLANNRVHRVIVGNRAYPMLALKQAPGATHRVLDLAHAVPQTWKDARLAPVSVLMGSALVDIVLDAFAGDVAFAALQLDGALRPAPLDAFAMQDGRPVLRLERRRIAALPGFTLEELDARLSEAEFLRRNAQLAHALTPP